MNKHTDFILTPITTVLEEAVVATSGVGDGIETYALCEYIMESVFLKMTGFQEQKMKCIAWEIATHDFEFRRKLLGNEFGFGEYSSYKAKTDIYKVLCMQLNKLQSDFSLFKFVKCQKRFDKISKEIGSLRKNLDEIEQDNERAREAVNQQITDKESIKRDLNTEKNNLKNVLTESIILGAIHFIENIFSSSLLIKYFPKKFNFFVSNSKNIIKKSEFFEDDKALLLGNVKEIYESLYSYRNRVAHNTFSYQNNLPTLDTLYSEKEVDRNYFVWFAVLILIDSIFIELYKKYLIGLQSSIY